MIVVLVHALVVVVMISARADALSRPRPRPTPRITNPLADQIEIFDRLHRVHRQFGVPFDRAAAWSIEYLPRTEPPNVAIRVPVTSFSFKLDLTPDEASKLMRHVNTRYPTAHPGPEKTS